MEADDYAVNCHQKYQGSSVLIGIDKDNFQSAGWHFNFVNKEARHTSQLDAQWLLAYQMLVGDAGDNIQGIFRVGDVKARLILAEGAELGLPPAHTVYLVYEELGLLDGGLYEENHRLLYMLRDTFVPFEEHFKELEYKSEDGFSDSEGDFTGVEL